MAKPLITVVLKKHHLQYAETWRRAAADWLMSESPDRHYEARRYSEWAADAEERAKTAPVKVILVYEDGSTQVMED